MQCNQIKISSKRHICVQQSSKFEHHHQGTQDRIQARGALPNIAEQVLTFYGWYNQISSMKASGCFKLMHLHHLIYVYSDTQSDSVKYFMVVGFKSKQCLFLIYSIPIANFSLRFRCWRSFFQESVKGLRNYLSMTNITMKSPSKFWNIWDCHTVLIWFRP